MNDDIMKDKDKDVLQNGDKTTSADARDTETPNTGRSGSTSSEAHGEPDSFDAIQSRRAERAESSFEAIQNRRADRMASREAQLTDQQNDSETYNESAKDEDTYLDESEPADELNDELYYEDDSDAENYMKAPFPTGKRTYSGGYNLTQKDYETIPVEDDDEMFEESPEEDFNDSGVQNTASSNEFLGKLVRQASIRKLLTAVLLIAISGYTLFSLIVQTTHTINNPPIDVASIQEVINHTDSEATVAFRGSIIDIGFTGILSESFRGKYIFSAIFDDSLVTIISDTKLTGTPEIHGKVSSFTPETSLILEEAYGNEMGFEQLYINYSARPKVSIESIVLFAILVLASAVMLFFAVREFMSPWDRKIYRRLMKLGDLDEILTEMDTDFFSNGVKRFKHVYITSSYIIWRRSFSILVEPLEEIAMIGTNSVLSTLMSNPISKKQQVIITFFNDKDWKVEFKRKSGFIDDIIRNVKNRAPWVALSDNPEVMSEYNQGSGMFLHKIKMEKNRFIEQLKQEMSTDDEEYDDYE